MRGLFSLYVDNDTPSNEEFNRLIDEMEEAIWNAFDEDEETLVKNVSRGERLITLYTLEGALCRTTETISGYRTGRTPVKRDVMHTTRLLHTLVTSKPNLARLAVLDNLRRVHGLTASSMT